MMRGMGAVLAAGVALATATAAAAETRGIAQEWQLGLQQAYSPTMERIDDFHTLLMWVITLISIFVLALLGYVMFRFRESANPTPSRTTHNAMVEVLWTVIPIIILVVIAVPSFRLLYYADRAPDAEMTIKAIGHQWYWSYEYPDHGGFTYDSLMIEEADLKEGQPRLLATDTHVVVPVNTKVRLLTTSQDVIHNWAMPAAGVKLDAVPGRINETWFQVTEEGTYYGQCSELCGIRHAFMPIQLEVVSKEEFAKWVKWAQEEYASAEDSAPVRIAEAARPAR